MRTVIWLILLCVSVTTSIAGAPDRPALKSGSVVTADGVVIHYLDAGRGPALLFVPGWTMPADIWDGQIAYFSVRNHRAVAMDPRAQGHSSQTADGLYPAARARDIRAIVDQLKLAPVVLVAWSMGVAEAAAYVDQFGAGTLAGLVLVDGIAGRDLDSPATPNILRFISAFQTDRRAATVQFVRSMYRTRQDEGYIERIVSASLRTPTSAAVALFLGTLSADLRPALSKIDKPTLLVTAPGPFRAQYEDMATRIAGARLEVFEDAGHALFVDQTAKFNALVLEFVQGLR